MDLQIIFWLFLSVTALELFAIYIISKAISSVIKSDVFREKLIKSQKKERKKISSAILSTLLMLIPSIALGAEENIASPLSIDLNSTTLIILATIDLILLGVILHLKKLLKSFVYIDKSSEELSVKLHKQSSINIGQVLMDIVPIEEEYKIETDHEYDGIRELDNSLPPWWKWGFAVSIVIAFMYMMHFHVFKTGELQIDEYKNELIVAEVNIQEYLVAKAMNVDETNVKLLVMPNDLKSGKFIFLKYCNVCHSNDGGGLVGPNLTDDYWIHGPGIEDVFKVIKYGGERGMKSWKDELNPIEMSQVASYILSLKGTTPLNPKDPEGEPY